jgi:hypothetical protein
MAGFSSRQGVMVFSNSSLQVLGPVANQHATDEHGCALAQASFT